jgi:hypothetical protein
MITNLILGCGTHSITMGITYLILTDIKRYSSFQQELPFSEFVNGATAQTPPHSPPLPKFSITEDISDQSIVPSASK